MQNRLDPKSYCVQDTVEIKKTETKNIFVMIENFKQVGKYIAGVYRIEKYLNNNQIKSVLFSKSLKDNYSQLDAKQLFSKYEYETNNRNNNAIDVILHSIVGFNFRGRNITKSVYNIKNEDELINLYLHNQHNIYKKQSSLSPQKISLGSGFIMNDTAGKTNLKLDYSELNPITLATMFVIEYASKNEVTQLTNAINAIE